MVKDIQEPEARGDLPDCADQRQPQTLLLNRDKPPFDNPDLRRAMALSLDRQAFIDISHRRDRQHRRNDAAAARRALGHAARILLKTLPGYDPDVQKKPRRSPGRLCRSSATVPRKAASDQACRPRDIPVLFAIPAVILIDQLKEIYIDARALKVGRHTAPMVPQDHAQQGLHGRYETLPATASDDPRSEFLSNTNTCGSENNINRLLQS